MSHRVPDYSSGEVVDPTVWDDVRVPLTTSGAGASVPSFGSFGTGVLQTYLFSNSGPSEFLYFTAQLPHRYKEGTDLRPHIHWAPSTGAAGNVKWDLEYVWLNLGDAWASDSSATGTEATPETAWEQEITGLTTLTGTSMLISSQLLCRLTRDNTVGSNYAADVAALEFDFHFEVESMGSANEFSK